MSNLAYSGAENSAGVSMNRRNPNALKKQKIAYLFR